MPARPGALVVAAATAVAVVAVGCGDDDGGVDRAGPTTSSTTTATPATDCTVEERPTVASGRPEVEGDFDGDGEPDAFLLYVDGDGDARARLELAAGGGADTSVGEFGTPETAVGAASTRPTGSGAVGFGVIGLGASSVIYSAFVLDGCELVRPTLDGRPNTLPVASSVASLLGVRCRPDVGELDTIEVASASSGLDGTRYEGTVTSYELRGTDLTPVDEEPIDVAVDDPEVGALAQFGCEAEE